jgi:hypothetical protein
VAESFFATIKRELVDRRPWPTMAGLQRAVFDWIEGWYNTRRLHSTLGYLSPARYEALNPPKSQQPSGIINSTDLSAKARQLHRGGVAPPWSVPRLPRFAPRPRRSWPCRARSSSTQTVELVATPA